MSRRKASAAAPTDTKSSNSSNNQTNTHEDDLEPDEQDKKGVSGFISKIYKMISDTSTEDIVCWNERGDGFIVKNEFIFASQIMKSYFRHQNFSSFVRQLNFYGFHKRSSPSSLTSFYHPNFRRNHPELLVNIQRKSTESKDHNLREVVQSLSDQVLELRQKNDDLYKIQQRILYIFSRYVAANTQQQMTGGNTSTIQSGGNEVESQKRLRSGNKRQRYLLEAKSEFPHRDRDRARDDVYDDDALSPNNSNIVDINTDHGYTTANEYNSNTNNNAYQSHNFSDYNWMSDPDQIQDLISKIPNSQLLNNTPMPLHMPRAAAANFFMAGDKKNNEGVTLRARNNARNDAASAFLELAPHLAQQANPKQLLEMLERMQGSSNASNSHDTADKIAGTDGAARFPERSHASSHSSLSHASSHAASNPVYKSHGIQGVFEDDEPQPPPRKMQATNTRTSARNNSKNNSSAPLPSSSSSSFVPSSSAPTFAPTVMPARTALIEDFTDDDDSKSISLGSNRSTAIPTIREPSPSFPLPASPLSPYLYESSHDAPELLPPTTINNDAELLDNIPPLLPQLRADNFYPNSPNYNTAIQNADSLLNIPPSPNPINAPLSPF